MTNNMKEMTTETFSGMKRSVPTTAHHRNNQHLGEFGAHSTFQNDNYIAELINHFIH